MEYAEIVKLAKKHPDLEWGAFYDWVTSYKHKQTAEHWHEPYLINWAFASALRQIYGMVHPPTFKYWNDIKPQPKPNKLR